ncbi:unnamed protein product [Nippostrongylus brasiliensis]|nr:unnamed protein product [Nippostrongylus brasiliensis]
MLGELALFSTFIVLVMYFIGCSAKEKSGGGGGAQSQIGSVNQMRSDQKPPKQAAAPVRSY